MKEGDKPAYPQTSGHVFKTGEMKNEKIYTVGGLTKREYFAAKAMQGICTHNHQNNHEKTPFIEWCAEMAVELADELLKELEK